MEQTSRHLAYRPEIDGLRALAVGIVVLYHVGLGCPGGFVGVDIFFVISGFLITGLVVRDLDAGTFSLARFYERRVRRILPASLAITAVVLIFGTFKLLPSDLESTGRAALAHAACAANVYFYGRTTNYFGGNVSNMPLLHLWSLGVEEQFYFVFPLLLWACYRWRRLRSRPALAAVLGVLLLGSFAESLYAVARTPDQAFFLLPGRAWELMVGALIAVFPQAPGLRAVREPVAWAGVAAMLWPTAAYSLKTSFPGLAALPPCGGAALFIWGCRGRLGTDATGFRQTWPGRVLSLRPVVFVGAISYSLYLVHWPILVFARYWELTPPTLTTRLLIVAASFAAAVVSWRWVEQPFRTRLFWPTRGRAFIGGAAGLAAVAIAGGVVALRHGLPGRYSQKVNALDAVRPTRLPLTRLRPVDLRRDRLVPFGDKRGDRPVSVLLWGDSHAAAALPAFDAFTLSRGLKGRASLYASRSPLLDYSIEPTPGGRAAAIAYNAAVLGYVAKQKIKTVFLAAYWSRDLTGGDAAVLDAAFGRTVAALRQLGVRTYVMLDVPAYAIDVPKGLACEAIHRRRFAAWHMSLAKHRQAQAAMYAIAAKYAAADCRFIDPAPFFEAAAGGDLAVADEAGHPYYFDAHHLTARGARRVLGACLERTVASDFAD